MRNKNIPETLKINKKNTRSGFSYLKTLSVVFALFIAQFSHAQVGTWAALKNKAPQQSAGLMLVLTDGRILCQDAQTASNGDMIGWMILTPDANGSYLNGTWATTGSNFQEHLFCNS